MNIARTLLAVCAVTFCNSAWSMSVTDIAVESIGSNHVRITWGAVDGADYYDVYENSVNRIATGLDTTSFERSGLAFNTPYQFFVTACTNDGVCSDGSPQADITTGSESTGDEPVFNSEPIVTYTDNGDGTATLNWTEVAGSEGYNIFLGGEYLSTVSAGELSAQVSWQAGNEYQVAWFAGDQYPAKSAIATEAADTPMSNVDILSKLEAGSAGSDTDVEIYFTRHAEKMTELVAQDDDTFIEVCGVDKCSEVLNPEGELRARLLVRAFADVGITSRLTHAFSSHKTRTRQTIEAIVAAAGLGGDVDKNPDDGIQEYPVLNKDGSANATELDPESTSGSEQPTIDALLALPAGSVALVAGHSGTLYDIMAGLGLGDVCLADTVDTCNQDRYPVDSKVKVRNFGDIWKIVLENGTPAFIYRVNLQPQQLEINELAR